MKVSTLVVGLNPALQKRLVLPGPLSAGDVHRVTEVQKGIGGKGQDVAVALHCLASGLGREEERQFHTRLLQFLGTGGQELQEQLAPLVDDVDALTVHCATPLRTCTSLVAPDATTELVEPSGAVSKAEIQDLWNQLDQVYPSTATNQQPTGVAFMGSLPPDCPKDIYAQLYQKLGSIKNDCVCLMDAVVGLPDLLSVIDGMPQHGPVVWKVNLGELCALVGQAKLENDDASVTAALEKFAQKFTSERTNQLHAIALTNGPKAAYLARPSASSSSATTWSVTKIPTPSLSSEGVTLYPIGAGDAVAAGTLAAWQLLRQQIDSEDDDKQNKGGSAPAWTTAVQMAHATAADGENLITTAFRFGLACGSASCLQEENSVLDTSKAVDMFQAMPSPVPMLQTLT